MCLCELFAPIRRGAYLIRRNDGRDVLYGMAGCFFFFDFPFDFFIRFGYCSFYIFSPAILGQCVTLLNVTIRWKEQPQPQQQYKNTPKMIKWTWFKENGIETKRDFLVALRMALQILAVIAVKLFGGICTEQHLKSMARSNILDLGVTVHIHWRPPSPAQFSSKFSSLLDVWPFPCSLFNCSWPF